MAKILVVDDDPSIVDALEFALAGNGFDVATAFDGVSASVVCDRERPDLILLDIMLPKLSGTEVCKLIRTSSDVPIIMLSARDSETDKVVSLELGADDYVTKPFSIYELTARVRAVLRRRITLDDDPTLVESNGVRIDIERYEVRVRGRFVALPPKELAVLELLMCNAGKVLPHEVMMKRIWGSSYAGDTVSLHVHVKRLRARIEQNPHAPQLITTVRGIGYRFADT